MTTARAIAKREVAGRPPCLAPGLCDRVEADEAGEEERRGREEGADPEGRIRLRGDGPTLGRHERRGKVAVVEHEAREDHHAAQQEQYGLRDRLTQT